MSVNAPPRQLRTLLVDDHVMVAESLRRVLAASDDIDVVDVVGTAAAAIAAAIALEPDVVVMDYRLPDGSGTRAAARIMERLPDTRIVMLTGNGDSTALREALEAGCVGYLEKTSGVNRLAEVVRAAAAGEIVVSAHHAAAAAGTCHVEPPPTALSERELEVLRLVAGGRLNQEVADLLFLSVNTVRSHVQSILEKLHAHSKLEATVVARRHGLID